MSIYHKFQEYDFGNNFQTHNSILDEVPYEPEVIFIGTFNHGWSWNQSDFFYGRGMYMWTVLGNLFLNDHNIFVRRRSITNNEPNYNQLFEICKKGKIVFADIVKGVRDDISTIENATNQSVLVNNEYVWRSYKDGPLDYMGDRRWLEDNVDEIIKYINKTKSIKHIYFTFRSGDWIIEKLKKIKSSVRKDVSSCSIFTPTVNGFGRNLAAPFNERAWSLAHCWIWNGLKHELPISRPGFGHLDHEWLRSKEIDPYVF